MDSYDRREFIKLSLGAFAAVALQFNSLSAVGKRANHFNGFRGSKDTLNWEAFLEEMQKLAKAQHKANWHQPSYLKAVRKVIEHYKFEEFENFKQASKNYKDVEKDWFEHELLHKEMDFQVSLLQFEKGEYISHHDHPSMCGIMTMVTGKASVKNFSIIETLDKEEVQKVEDQELILKSCVIKKEKEEILLPNKISTLTSTKRNIHSLMPLEFTQLVDIFTPAYSEKSEQETKWFSVNENENYSGKKNLYLAKYAQA